MTPRGIYERYTIMPNLQLHQLRVAAVGKLICDNFTEHVDARSVILACLFHDMGNILKFDFSVLPEFTEPQGREYWESVKAQFVQKYGSEQHEAHVLIAREIGLPEMAISCIAQIGFSQMEKVAASPSYELKIAEYADMRVGPHGILPMEERIFEGRKRYLARGIKKGITSDEQRFSALLETARLIESQLFERCSLRHEDISDLRAAPVIEQLWDYTVA